MDLLCRPLADQCGADCLPRHRSLPTLRLQTRVEGFLLGAMTCLSSPREAPRGCGALICLSTDRARRIARACAPARLLPAELAFSWLRPPDLPRETILWKTNLVQANRRDSFPTVLAFLHSCLMAHVIRICGVLLLTVRLRRSSSCRGLCLRLSAGWYSFSLRSSAGCRLGSG